MPWVSTAQARWGHSPAGKKALGSKGVAEWDSATPKGSLTGTKGSKWVKSARKRKVERGQLDKDSN